MAGTRLWNEATGYNEVMDIEGHKALVDIPDPDLASLETLLDLAKAKTKKEAVS